MVEIEHLTKTYGTQNAVDNISFTAGKGEIVGFLGPNGAGKSTTMKIATGYLPPTAGTVRVAGFDVLTHSLDVRRHVGYLPEHNPLYLDMYVHEYLEFIGSVHGLRGSGLRNRVAELVRRVGLSREQNKQIGALSKGYRQRVGLAQALIHNPDVLILDEPTTGLDPIIGQGDRGKLRFNYTYGAAGCRLAAFEQLVSLRGGEYFYAPSRSGLAQLAGGAAGAVA